jgi:L-serine dehydratase
VAKIEIHLFGSLALTGHGHGTGRALIAGLMGLQPETVDPETVLALNEKCSHIQIGGTAVEYEMITEPRDPPSGHPNALRFIG